jgi:gluconolactonase
VITTVVEGLDHPECVAFGTDGALYAGGEAGQIYRIDPVGGTFEVIARVGNGLILGIALDAHNNVYACDAGGGRLARVSNDGKVETISRGTEERPMRIPNFAVFDSTGFLYVSDSGSWTDGGGCIYRLSPDGDVKVWSEAAPDFPNGLAMSPDGSALYVAESILPGITRIPVLSDGTAGEPESVVAMPGTVPDGLAFDISGRLYIACYRPDRIYALETGGELKVVADDARGTDLSAPTNVAFGGRGMKQLYIASLGRWHIGRIDVPDAGATLNYPISLIPSGAHS